ncbi:MAG TPA: helix-turn-helix transcriptional regulator [Rugosimonospora sp.]|nr:helix-turn-helix transcriptional regulator [Rugosimonospora sp.]
MPGRPEIPIDPGAPFADFAIGLRTLRSASNKTYKQMAVEVNYGISVLCTAASGRILPSLGVTLAFVRACDGPVAEWVHLWELARAGGRRHR